MFEKLLFGEYSLPVTFWIFYIVGSLVSLLIGGIAGLFVGMMMSGPLAVFATTAIIFGGYFLIASIGVWKSAGSYPGMRLWSLIARIIVVVVGISTVYHNVASNLPFLSRYWKAGTPARFRNYILQSITTSDFRRRGVAKSRKRRVLIGICPRDA
jgi:hypothetical protein